jgi:transmembrane sensor
VDDTMSEKTIDQAIAWHQGQDRDDFDWDGFTRWLEADPAHRAAFDEIALLDAGVDAHRETLAAILPSALPREEPPAAPRRRWLGWAAGGGVAAALALAVGVSQFLPHAPAPVDYSTAPGQTRTIALADGSKVALAASSHLRVEGAGQDRLTLEGAAFFDIPHRPGRTMTVRAGQQRIVDIGTRFDVLAAHGLTRVAVAEGSLSIRSARLAQAVPLTAGHQLLVDEQAGSAQVSPTNAADIGSWREGRLVYDDAPLSLVAADISRYADRPVEVSPDVARRHFSGVLVIGDGSGLVGEIAQLMDLEIGARGRAVHLRARR